MEKLATFLNARNKTTKKICTIKNTVKFSTPQVGINPIQDIT